MKEVDFMKKIIMLLLVTAMTFTCFGCTAIKKNLSGDGVITPDVSIPTICDGNEEQTMDDIGEETSTGWNMVLRGEYLNSKNGHLIISETGPIELRTKDESIFDDLTDGDVIEVACLYVEESYPGGTDVLELWKKSDGEYEDIDKDVLLMLAELGWVDKLVIEDEPDELIGYYYSAEGNDYILAGEESIYIYPHPDMVEDVQVIYGYTDGDLIVVQCELVVDGEYKYAKVWSSELIEEGTPENLVGIIGEE